MTSAGQRLRLGSLPAVRTQVLAGLDRWYAAFVGLALLGVVLVLILTKPGPGVGGDSVHYVMGAQNIATGEGFSRLSGGGEIKPITHFPPIFSIVLSPLALLGAELFSAARILNAVLFGVTVFLGASMVRAATRSGMAALIAALLLLGSEPLLTAFSYVMTEALYIVLSLAAIVFLARYLGDAEARGMLIISAAFIAASVLTRYAGLSLAAACGAGLLLLGNRKWRDRAKDAVLFGVVALAPLGLWFLRNRLMAGTVTNRAFSFHSMSRELVNTYLGEIVALVFARQVPLRWRPRALLAGLIAWAGPTYFVARLAYARIKKRTDQLRERPHYSLRWLLVFYTVAYFAAFVANTLFFDAGTTLSVVDRYLAPGYVVFVILGVMTSHDLLSTLHWRRAAISAGFLLAVFLIAIHAVQAAQLFGTPGIDLGYTRVRNENPAAVDALRELNPHAEVVSNNPELFYVLAGRPAYRSPILQDPSSLEIRTDYEDQVGLVRQVLADGGGLVLLFPIREDDMLVLEHVEVKQARSLLVGSIYLKGSDGSG